MRGHGCVVVGPYLRRTVYTAIYLELNAKLQMQAEAMSKKVQFLTKGEVEQGRRDHVAGQRQPRLGELVPRGRTGRIGSRSSDARNSKLVMPGRVAGASDGLAMKLRRRMPGTRLGA